MSIREVSGLEAARSVKRIAFDSYEIIDGIVAGRPLLVVRGRAPCLNMQVALSPLIYIDCPDYWGIEVVGTLPGGICLTALEPYTVSIPLAGIIGCQGIEILGAGRTERVALEGGCRTGQSFE